MLIAALAPVVLVPPFLVQVFPVGAVAPCEEQAFAPVVVVPSVAQVPVLVALFWEQAFLVDVVVPDVAVPFLVAPGVVVPFLAVPGAVVLSLVQFC